MHITEQHISDARIKVLADSDSLADWIGAQCFQAGRNTWPHMVEATMEDFQGISVAKLLALSADRGQPAKVRCAALDAITEQYLADDDTPAYVIRTAIEIAKGEFEDRQDFIAEAAAQFRRIMGYSPAKES